MIKKEFALFELVVLLKFTPVEEITQGRIDFIKTLINGKGSHGIAAKNCGKQALAYPIKKFTEVTSLQFVFVSNSYSVEQIIVELQRSEFVLRVLGKTVPY
jgi:ribosomal protein S6